VVRGDVTDRGLVEPAINEYKTHTHTVIDLATQPCLRWGRIEQGVAPQSQSSKINGLRRSHRP